MSLYHLIHGRNPIAPMYLRMLNLDLPQAVPRLRDVHLYEEEGNVLIGVYTRVGGGNREDYEDEIALLRMHPLYVRDADDTFDSTYATFFFRVPDDAQSMVENLLKLPGQVQVPEKMWRRAIEKLESGDTSDREVAELMERMEPVVQQLRKIVTGLSDPAT